MQPVCDAVIGPGVTKEGPISHVVARHFELGSALPYGPKSDEEEAPDRQERASVDERD